MEPLRRGRERLVRAELEEALFDLGGASIVRPVRGKAGLEHNMPPHRLRHFLFTWLETKASTTP